MALAFKVDENLPKEVAALLREQGHDASTLWDQGLEGTADPDISRICRAEGRALVTLDVDFADIRVYPPVEHPGLIVLRLEHQDKSTVLAVLSRVLPLLAEEQLAQRLWIVEHDRVRMWWSWEED